MTLDIIVPHYREPWEKCKFLFETIATQRGVDFNDINVIVVNDGRDCQLDVSHFSEYPFQTILLTKEHEGVSAARNFGIDNSDADYVMFCDADDGFLSNFGLHLIFSAMREGFDMLTSCFVEEVWDVENKFTHMVRHERDVTFVHGKVFRRSFLNDKNIRFAKDVTVHEDGVFNHICLVESGDNLKDISTPIYIWRWNGDSTVRRDPKHFVLKTYGQLMRGRDFVCSQLRDRGLHDDFQLAVAKTVLDSFYDSQKAEWRAPENRGLVEAAEAEFRKFWNKYKMDFFACDVDKVAEIADASRFLARKDGLFLEAQALPLWITHIESGVKNERKH